MIRGQSVLDAEDNWGAKVVIFIKVKNMVIILLPAYLSVIKATVRYHRESPVQYRV